MPEHAPRPPPVLPIPPDVAELGTGMEGGTTPKTAARAIAIEASGTIGGTPLVALRRLGDGLDGRDRRQARVPEPGWLGQGPDRVGDDRRRRARSGALEPGGAIVEPTSGNTGIALALVCAARGYELTLTLPEGMSRERTKLLRSYGAEVHETPSLGGMGEAIRLAEEIVAERGAFMPQQFSNPANPEIHRRTTAEEIWRDLGGEVDVLVTGVGTGGTITGVGEVAQGASAGFPRGRGRAVRPRRSSPAVCPDLHKIQGIGAGFVPEVLDRDRDRRGDRGRRRGGARSRARRGEREGLLVGISAGAAFAAALELAARPEMAGKRIVTIACDGGERYVSLPFFAPD